ncbi:MAG: aminopeptidase P family protein [Kordiimonadaceae bacterium]|nr:aminopeptidase P family protein [Kordiimonadaceae bacterium]MBO6568854.1 aminopeptidase P family protein [Kordiimonadaceae bacterium]MBO6965171.1 aminopeptidase P family protein [Kordiimonadaceae bacterium]
MFSKRSFLKGALGVTAASVVAPSVLAATQPGSGLNNIAGDAVPISVEERKARVARAQELMREYGLSAVLIEPGSSMQYFAGIRWGRSERLTAVIIPAEGEIAVVTPYFEEPTVRERMSFGDDVRTWHEHESPFARVAEILKDRGVAGGIVGFEPTVRYFVVEGLKGEGIEVADGWPVTYGCRMIKTTHELQLMHKANEITLKAYEEVWDKLEAGMAPSDINAMMRSSQTALGGSSIWGMALLAEASAYPHGTNTPQSLKEGDIVLMDCGCSVEGYRSDISRTFVFGEPSKHQQEVWNTVRQGQNVAMAAAQIGRPTGSVDDAVRRYYESQGWGPDYQTPGLSHRTGHGIGMDIHEPVNFVRGETEPLAPGMCFSNEPGLYDFDAFGVRIEDCIYMTEAGPKWFTEPPESLEKPVGKVAAVPS